jgi:hypothetical protein
MRRQTHQISLGLTHPQMLKLRRGHGVRVPHHHLRGPHRIIVGAVTARRHAKAHRLGMGMVLRPHEIMGGSLFGDLAKGAWNLAKPVASKFLREKVLPWGAEKLTGLAKSGLSRLGLGRRRMPRKMTRPMTGNPYARPPLRGMSSGLPAMVQGTGRRRVTRRGGSFFSDIGDWFKKPSNIVGALGKVASYLPVPGANYASKGLDIASQGLRAVGHGRRRVHRGRGLFLPGMGRGLNLPGAP